LIVWTSFKRARSLRCFAHALSSVGPFTEGNTSSMAAVLFLELLDQVQPVADLLQAIGVELDLLGIGRDLARRFFDLGAAGFAELQNRRQAAVDGCDLAKVGDGFLELGQRGMIGRIERFVGSARKAGDLFRVGKQLLLARKRFVLAWLQLGGLDLVLLETEHVLALRPVALPAQLRELFSDVLQAAIGLGERFPRREC
jgi:hypothetical protein